MQLSKNSKAVKRLLQSTVIGHDNKPCARSDRIILVTAQQSRPGSLGSALCTAISSAKEQLCTSDTAPLHNLVMRCYRPRRFNPD